MKASLIIILFLLLTVCTPKPSPIQYGSDECAYCKMTIMDQRYAAELVTTKSKVFKFDATECMIHFVEKTDEEFAMYLVTDYRRPGTLIDATTAFYLRTIALPSPMGMYITAFGDETTAEEMHGTHGGQRYHWNELTSRFHGLPLIQATDSP